jgi:hypothetical protein
MGQKGKESDLSEQATCEVCGLTARDKEELKDHIRHAHRDKGGEEAGELEPHFSNK